MRPPRYASLEAAMLAADVRAARNERPYYVFEDAEGYAGSAQPDVCAGSALRHTARPKHFAGWALSGPGTVRLAAGVDWSDPFVRADVRSDARTLSTALGRDIVIARASGEPIETIPAVPS